MFPSGCSPLPWASLLKYLGTIRECRMRASVLSSARMLSNLQAGILTENEREDKCHLMHSPATIHPHACHARQKNISHQVRMVNDHKVCPSQLLHRLSERTTWYGAPVSPKSDGVYHHNLQVLHQAPLLQHEIKNPAGEAYQYTITRYWCCPQPRHGEKHQANAHLKHSGFRPHFCTCRPSSRITTPSLRLLSREVGRVGDWSKSDSRVVCQLCANLRISS